MLSILNYYSNFEIVKTECAFIVSGFLTPDGTFDECGWAEHTNLAYEILRKNDWYDEYRKSREYWGGSARDFLIRRKFYILFDNPSRNGRTQTIIFNPFIRRTKAQMNKMFELIKHSNTLTEIMLQKVNAVEK